tara:strand:+ start:1731 stop:2330 length:600 start_codon:yes stop_codon:yes gene_type:complete
MKVKVKQGKKVKEFDFINSWEEVTLEKWVKMTDFGNKTKSEQAEKTIALLSNMPKDMIKKLELSDVAAIMSAVGQLQQDQETGLKRIIEVEGEKYGFHPDLDLITIGEYADLETYIKMGLEQNMPEVMAILYRPILEQKGKLYSIQPYDGEIKMRAEVMRKMPAEQVQSALVFFWVFVNELLRIMPSSLIARMKAMKTQ